MFGKKAAAKEEVPASLPGRNDPCHCGSGKKYKKCCLAKDDAKSHTVLEKKWTDAEKEFAKEKEKEASTKEGAASADKSPTHRGPDAATPHVSKHQIFTAPKFNMPRKAGGGS
jgi:hypothetical protein